MNQKILLLLNRNRLTNKEMFSFLKILYDLIYDFLQNLSGGGEEERPGELAVRSTPQSLLSTILSEFKDNIDLYEKVLNLPRKFIETEEMIKVNRLRLLEFSMIKKNIYSAYQNDKNNSDAQKLWFLIRIYKNMNKLKISAVHTNMLKFITDMESDTYKTNCETLKVTDKIANIKNKNIKFEELLVKRSLSINNNYKSVRPYRKNCEIKYLEIYDTIVSIINLDPYSDYSEFISKINGHTYYYNNITYIKKTRSENKKNNTERPGELIVTPEQVPDVTSALLPEPSSIADPGKKDS